VNSIILLGLIVMWAVVLIPMWLRRHDEHEEERSVDRFTSAMHTLSRRDREAEADKRYVVMPNRYSSRDVHVSGASDESTDQGSRWSRLVSRLPQLPGTGSHHADDALDDEDRDLRPAAARSTARTTSSRLAARPAERQAERPPAGPRPPAPPPRRLTAAERRRRTLVGLALLTAVSLIPALAVGGVVVWAVQIVLDLVLLAYVVHLRRRAMASAAAARRARRRPTPYVEPQRGIDPAYVEPKVSSRDRIPPLVTPVLERRPSAAPEPVPVAAPASAIAFEDPYEESLDEAAAAEGIGARPWEPVRVPPPVYTTKPVAPPRRRPIPDTEPLLPAVDTGAELDPADDLEEILDRRWAVND
jgi:hypothetical protein